MASWVSFRLSNCSYFHSTESNSMADTRGAGSWAHCFRAMPKLKGFLNSCWLRSPFSENLTLSLRIVFSALVMYSQLTICLSVLTCQQTHILHLQQRHGKLMSGKELFTSGPEVCVQFFLTSPFLPETFRGPTEQDVNISNQNGRPN